MKLARISCILAAVVTLMLFSRVAWSQDVDPKDPMINEAATATGVAEPAEPELPYPHPRLSSDARWAGVMAFIIVPALFLAAAMIGSLVYSELPQEHPPVAHSHDEPPGGSGHHGPGGTVQPGPEHELPGGHAEHH
jgi:hypothetical protein